MNIVLVAHDFEPGTSAGAARSAALASGLARRGFEVAVITAEPAARSEDVRVIAVPYQTIGDRAKSAAGIDRGENLGELAARRGRLIERAVRTAAHAGERVLMRPDPQHLWIRAVRDRLPAAPPFDGPADAVVASALPLSAIQVGADVADAWGCPLVVEYRDLWSANPRYPYGSLRSKLDGRYERRLLHRALHVVVVARGLADGLRAVTELVPTVIENGVDPLPSSRAPAAADAGAVFSLGYVGVTYAGDHDLRPLLAVIASLDGAGGLDASSVRFHVYGDRDASLRQEAERLGLGEVLLQHGYVARDQLQEALSDVHVALCPLSERDRDTLPVKVMEYLASGRTLVVTGADPDWELRGAARRDRRRVLRG